MDIETKDGIILRGIPDGTPDEAIRARIEKIRSEKSPAPEKPVAGSEPLPSTGERLSRMGSAAAQGMMFGPIGAIASATGEGMTQFGQGVDRLAHKGGEAVSQAIAPYVPGEVAGGAGYLTNVGIQAIPTLLGGAIGSKAAPLMEKGGETLMRMALKPSTTLAPDKAARAVKTMLTADVGNILPGANVTPGGIGQIQTKIGSLGDEVTNLLTPSTAQVSRDAVMNALNKTQGKFATQVTPASDLKAIKAVGDEFASTYPKSIPIQQAQKLKQGTYAVLGDKAYKGELKAAETEAQKALASGLRTEIENAIPQVGPINAQQSDLINAVKAFLMCEPAELLY